MKHALASAALGVMLFITGLDAKDFTQAEDVINTILNDSSEKKAQDRKGDAAKSDVAKQEGDDDKTGAALPERKNATGRDAAAEKKAGRDKEETAPPVTSEEQVLLKTGIDFFGNGLYENARNKFQELISKFPQSGFRDSAHVWMGKINLKLYQYDSAIKEFQAVPANSGEYPAAVFYTAEGFMMKGDRVSSIEFYQKVFAQFPSHELADSALLNMGRLYLNQNNGPQALDSAVKIIKFYKDRKTVPSAYYLIGKIYETDARLKDIEMARKIYRQFIKKGAVDDRFGASPLKRRVLSDLSRIEKTYYKLEK